jgi:hypothetical protein
MALHPYESPIFSGAITANATPLGQQIPVPAHRSMILNVHITSIDHAGTIQLAVQGRDAYGHFANIPGAVLGPVDGTATDYQLYLGPGLPSIPGQSVPVLLPAVIQLAETLASGGLFHADVGAVFID